MFSLSKLTKVYVTVIFFCSVFVDVAFVANSLTNNNNNIHLVLMVMLMNDNKN